MKRPLGASLAQLLEEEVWKKLSKNTLYLCEFQKLDLHVAKVIIDVWGIDACLGHVRSRKRLVWEASAANGRGHVKAWYRRKMVATWSFHQNRLQRVNTPADGNCFLIAASWSAGIHIDHFALRQQVVSYLGTYRCLFSSSSTSNSFLQPLLVLRSYVARWPWGHDLCVMAFSHL